MKLRFKECVEGGILPKLSLLMNFSNRNLVFLTGNYLDAIKVLEYDIHLGRVGGFRAVVSDSLDLDPILSLPGGSRLLFADGSLFLSSEEDAIRNMSRRRSPDLGEPWTERIISMIEEVKSIFPIPDVAVITVEAVNRMVTFFESNDAGRVIIQRFVLFSLSREGAGSCSIVVTPNLEYIPPQIYQLGTEVRIGYPSRDDLRELLSGSLRGFWRFLNRPPGGLVRDRLYRPYDDAVSDYLAGVPASLIPQALANLALGDYSALANVKRRVISGERLAVIDEVVRISDLCERRQDLMTQVYRLIDQVKLFAMDPKGAPVKSVMLYAPRGFGVRTLAKAITTPYVPIVVAFYITSMLSKWVGESEAFAMRALSWAEEHSPSALIFMDLDLALKREEESTAQRNVMSIVTNHIENQKRETFCVAVVRDPMVLPETLRSAFDRVLPIPALNRAEREAMLRYYMMRAGLDENAYRTMVSLMGEALDSYYRPSDFVSLYNEALLLSKLYSRSITVADFKEAAKRVSPQPITAEEERILSYGSSFRR
ncbi:MAG: ATP-binding protein [Candidatus Korarchaeum sp.]